MAHISRKDFLRTSALAAAGSLFIPNFLKALNTSGTMGKGEKILVVIQLGGGNDGLNTIVNHGNDLYYKARPQLAISASEALKLDDMQGLHPALAPLRPFYDDGQFSILNAVGYPNPDRSHFRSMDIWQTGSAANEYRDTGWLGRYMDAACQDCSRPTTLIEVGDKLSLALKGQERKGLAVSDPQRFRQVTSAPFFKLISQHQSDGHHDHSQAAYLYKTLGESISSADYILEKSKSARNKAEYPQSPLAKQLRTTAQLIAAGVDTRVYYLDMGGFDTHVNQKGQHKRLLENYAGAVAAFVKDLKAHGRWDDVLLMTFSEFGRRVQQNASNGTDHGTANNLFLLGGKLRKGGIYNAAPDLSDLDKGDLKYKLDFRRVYAEVLDKWLGVSSRQILGAGFEGLGVI